MLKGAATGAATVSVNVTVEDFVGELESCIATLKEKLPLAAGVPESKPVVVRVIPEGSCPEAMFQE
jgi:hypothetical protein